MKKVIALCMALTLVLGGVAAFASEQGNSAALSDELLGQLTGEDQWVDPAPTSAALSSELLGELLGDGQGAPEPEPQFEHEGQAQPEPQPEWQDDQPIYEGDPYVDEDIASAGSVAAISWRGHELSAQLFTRDAAQVNVSPMPAHGYLVLIRLAADAPIAYADIERNTGDFVLASDAGNIGKPLYWRVRGLSFLNGTLTTDPLQNDFELIYLVGDDVPMEALRLAVATGDPGEVQMLALA